jgi:hypothetical protein
LSERVRVGAALRALATPHAVLVVLALALLTLTPQVVPKSWETVFTVIFTAWIAGYSLSVSRNVLLGSDDPWGRFFALREHGRRAIAYWLLIAIPLFIVGVPLTVLGLIASLAASPALGDVTGWVSFVGVLILSFACVLLAPVVPIARYVYFDRFGEGLRYLDAGRRAWRHRRDAAVPVFFTLTVGLLSLLMRYGLGQALGARHLDVGEAARGLAAGSVSARLVAVVALGAASSVVAGVVLLVEAHLVGQYVRIAYSAPEEEDWERSA